jgi:hypothetical protein
MESSSCNPVGRKGWIGDKRRRWEPVRKGVMEGVATVQILRSSNHNRGGGDSATEAASDGRGGHRRRLLLEQCARRGRRKWSAIGDMGKTGRWWIWAACKREATM